MTSRRLFRQLSCVCDALILTEQNWRAALNHLDPELILVESCWSTSSGDWYQALFHPGASRDRLIELLEFARRKGIPRVFWNTMDPCYFSLCEVLLPHFDAVFHSDARLADANGYEAMPPCMAPSLTYPFSAHGAATDDAVRILFEGLADAIRHPDDFAVLRRLLEHELRIIDARYRFFGSKVKDAEELATHFLGSVSYRGWLAALRETDLFVSAEPTLATALEQSWRNVEVAGNRIPVLHRGALIGQEWSRSFVHAVGTDDALVSFVEQLSAEPLLRNRIAQASWREAHSRHSIFDRVTRMCELVGVDYLWEKYPLISVITPTFRPDLLEKCVRQFDEQAYPNKELILVLNSDDGNALCDLGDFKNRPDITLSQLPRERVAGGCINFAMQAAHGKYCVKMDDDDFYGRHYVSDMILHQHAIDADVFGKKCRYFYFEDEDATYARTDFPLLGVIPRGKRSAAHISGASLSGRREYFLKHRFSDENFGANDTHFHSNNEMTDGRFALLDDSGLITFRAEDANKHTWRTDPAQMKARMVYVCNGIARDALE